MPATGKNCNFKYMILSIYFPFSNLLVPLKNPPYAYDYTHSCACSTDINIKLYFHVCLNLTPNNKTPRSAFLDFFYFTFQLRPQDIIYLYICVNTGVHVC